MLPSDLRLTRQQFIQFLEKDHQVVFNRLGTLKYTLESRKYAVVVSSKHEKHAVVRNKVKRWIYSLLRQQNPPFGGILYLSKHAYSMNLEEITQLFNELSKKATK